MTDKPDILTRYLKKAVAAAASGCILILLVAAILARAEVHTYVLTYRLVPDDGQASRQAVSSASETINKRMQALAKSYKLKDYRAEPLAPDQVRLQFTTRSDSVEVRELLAWLTGPGCVEFCLVHPDITVLEEGDDSQPPDGYEPKTYEEHLYRLGKPGELLTRRYRYLVRKEPLLRVRGVEEARFSTAGLGKATVLTFQLPKEQAEEFRDITALNVGREMAMLVDGDLFFPPRQIASGMEGRRVQVQGYFYNPPLRKLIAVLSAGSLPGRLEQVSQGIR